jgi:hypothetical protein
MSMLMRRGRRVEWGISGVGLLRYCGRWWSMWETWMMH